MISGKKLVRTLVECVSHNGNLLIGVGPKADGTIPDIQADRLRLLGAWLRIHGEAIYKTRVWAQRQSDKLTNDAEVFYTRDTSNLFAIIDGLPIGTHDIELPVYSGKIKVEVLDEYPVHIKLVDYFN